MRHAETEDNVDMSKHGVYGVSDSDDLQSTWSDIDFYNAIFCS